MSYVGSARRLQGRSYSIYPATIKQLLRAEQPHSQSSFFVDGIKLDKVTCVAGIVDIREYDSAKVYILEDGSGGRLRSIWLLGSETNLQLGIHVYVRVTGMLKVYNGVNELGGMQIRPVLDMHEPFFHCLEAMVALVSSTQRTSQSTLPPTQLATAAVSQSLPSVQRHAPETRGDDEDHPTGTAQESARDDVSDTTFEEFDRLTLVDHSDEEPNEEGMFRQLSSFSQQQPSRPPSRPPANSFLAASSPSSLLQDPYSSLSPLQREIMVQFYNNGPLFPDGVPIRAIYRGVNHSTVDGYEVSEIWQAIEDMMDDGLLYSTIDQDHFKMVD
ncbi:hypothetical protein BJV78DRAFT_1278433 [Lactifluus subvellereus]|nr:hypothetical protein BJV78DRAFT_1278433 [Lactifluus subvellereus]